MSAAGDRHRSRRLDDALAFRLHRTNRLLRTHLMRVLDEHGEGMTPEQYFVLARLGEHQPRRQVELTEPVLGDPPNVSRLVDALERRGFVERRPDEVDRRSRVLHLTPAGEALAASLRPHVVRSRRLVFDGFDGPELDALESALDRLDANLAELLDPER